MTKLSLLAASALTACSLAAQAHSFWDLVV